MITVNPFRPVHFIAPLESKPETAETDKTASPADLLAAFETEISNGIFPDLETGLEQDTFLRRVKPAMADPEPMAEEAFEDHPMTGLEMKYGDFSGATLMVLDEMQHLISRLALEEGHDVQLQAFRIPSANPQTPSEEHVMLEAADERVYAQLHKALLELGAARVPIQAGEENDPGNRMKYANVPLMLFERGLEEDQLPPAVLQVKQARESLALAGTAQQAANALSRQLNQQGLSDIQVHPLEMQPASQLWVLYPVTQQEGPENAREQTIRNAIALSPDSDWLDGKLAFRHGNQVYGLAFAPNVVPSTSPEPLKTTGLLPRAKAWYDNLVQMLKDFWRKQFGRQVDLA